MPGGGEVDSLLVIRLSMYMPGIYNVKSSQAKENGLRGRSGERGLSAFANSSSPESALEDLASELRPANSGCGWAGSGGYCGTGLTG